MSRPDCVNFDVVVLEMRETTTHVVRILTGLDLSIERYGQGRGGVETTTAFVCIHDSDFRK